MNDKKQVEEMTCGCQCDDGREKIIEPIRKHMLEATNMTEQEAYDFAFRCWQCNYRKISENEVVIDKNENPCLSCPVPEDIQRDVDCSTICGAVRLGIDWQNQCKVLVKENKQLTKELAQARKKTAREICLKTIKGQPQPIKEKWVEWFKKEYGVEVE